MRKYANKIKNTVTFRIKTGYNLQILNPCKRKLLESIKSKITKRENGENLPHLKITHVVLVTVILQTKIINKIQKSCKHLLCFY